MNASWQATWPNSRVTNGTTFGSDHCPIIVQCMPQADKVRKPFHFEAFWTKDEECRNIVKEVWELEKEGTLLDRWNKKMNLCRAKLIKWSNAKFKNQGRQIKEMMKHLNSLQHNWRQNRQEIDGLSKRVD